MSIRTAGKDQCANRQPFFALQLDIQVGRALSSAFSPDDEILIFTFIFAFIFISINEARYQRGDA